MAHLQESSGIDWKNCSQVEINPAKLSGTPILRGSRMPVDAIVQNYRSGLPAEEIAEIFELPPDGVRKLLAYAVTLDPALNP